MIVVIAVLLGAVGGFFLARKYMQDYLKKNHPVNEDMLRSMMMSMGQKPSEKKITANDATNEKPKIGFLAQKRADPISSLFVASHCD